MKFFVQFEKGKKIVKIGRLGDQNEKERGGCRISTPEHSHIIRRTSPALVQLIIGLKFYSIFLSTFEYHAARAKRPLEMIKLVTVSNAYLGTWVLWSPRIIDGGTTMHKATRRQFVRLFINCVTTCQGRRG